MLLSRFCARAPVALMASMTVLATACAPAPANAPAAPPQPTAPAQQGAPAAAATPSGTPMTVAAGAAPANAGNNCPNGLRKLTIAAATTPPNVVHTPPFIARGLGIFAKRCIDAEIVQFEGGLSQTNITAVARGSVMSSINATAIGQGIKAHQLWGMAPRLPQAYVVGPDIKAA